MRSIDGEQLKQDFPILQKQINGNPLVYLDNAASMQKPNTVLNAIRHCYENEYANIHRGVHTLSQLATDAYEKAREKVQHFINAKHSSEIVFVRGTTEAINLVAQTFGRSNIKQDDEIIISTLEHHSNIVPWQMLCEQTGAKLKVIPINDAGELLQEQYQKLFNDKTKLVAVTHMSNALGTINPIKEMIAYAKQRGVATLIDGAQAVSHLKVDVQALDCDFYAFSGHKLYGPSGIGVLYGKKHLLENMPPYQGGGEMIATVTFEKTTYHHIPNKFEAGTPNIVGTIGLGAAIDYINEVGIDAIAAHEAMLLDYATSTVQEISGVNIVGTASCKASVLSFTMQSAHPHDVGTILDNQGIAIRAGHHCAMPLMQRFNIPATARASFSMYNTKQDVDSLVQGLIKVNEVFS